LKKKARDKIKANLGAREHLQLLATGSKFGEDMQLLACTWCREVSN